MVKKKVKKKKTISKKRIAHKRKTIKKPTIRRPKIPKADAKVERVLIENFVGLQKVMVHLSVKFDDLSEKIAKLLELFEISAKALAEKDLTVEKTARDDTKIIHEIGNLSEQNKVIARGLTLMHNRLSGEAEQPIERQPQMPRSIPPQMSLSRPPMRQAMQKPAEQGTATSNKGSMEGYQKSIASDPFKENPT